MKCVSRALFAVVVVLLVAPQVWAQATAQVNGTVADASGAVLPGVTVTATQTAAWADVDNDGNLDLFVGNENAAAQLYLNRGDGTFRIPNAPWRFAGSDVRAGGVPKYRGEDNRAVLSELLGLDAATLDQLEAQGVLTSRVPGGAR